MGLLKARRGAFPLAPITSPPQSARVRAACCTTLMAPPHPPCSTPEGGLETEVGDEVEQKELRYRLAGTPAECW